MSDKQWSEELQRYTRDLLDKGTFGINPSTCMVCFKHINGQYGFIEASDASEGKYQMHVLGSEETISFPNSASLVGAGWALD